MIYVTGDTHSLNDIKKLEHDLRFINPEDYLIVAGDFGICWDDAGSDAQTFVYWASKPYTVLFVDGNHENFPLLYSYPEEIWNGGRIHRIGDNIIHLMRGQVFEIEGKKIFTFGGGLSIDKALREDGITWWKEEEPSVAECEEGMTNLDKVGWKVDYVITHAAPETIVRNEFAQIVHLYKKDCICEKYLNEIYRNLDFELWICGHYHFDHLFRKEKVLELYQDVVRLSPGYPIVNTRK